MFEEVRAERLACDQPAAHYDGSMTLRAADVATGLRSHFSGVLPTKKLHKLLYYGQGHHLAATGTPLFSDTVSAWDMGPVVGALWKQEDEAGPVTSAAVLDESQLNTIGYVLSRYGSLTGADLERLAHTEAPWMRANEGRRPRESARIEQDWMREYFSNETDDEEPVFDSAVVSSWLADTTRQLPDLTEDDYDQLAARLTNVR